MASWATAADLSQRYAVGLSRLLDYSRRGNLPMSHDASGTPVFDENIVKRLFGSRSVPVASEAPGPPILGSVQLGPASEPPLGAREARRREIWRKRREAVDGEEPETERRTG
jgi:hypothetical protein